MQINVSEKLDGGPEDTDDQPYLMFVTNNGDKEVKSDKVNCV
jgi:hypothetical protein